MVDAAAFERAAQEALPGLYRLSMSILHAQHDAQDAVQQGLLRAWERRAQARPDELRAWLTRIIINECRNIQRRRMRVFPVEAMPEAAAPEESEEDADLRRAVDGLPEKLRTPLLLRYMERYSEKEIAAAIGVSVSTVKNRLFRARRALREALLEEVTFR